jgi:hypothetical protein
LEERARMKIHFNDELLVYLKERSRDNRCAARRVTAEGDNKEDPNMVQCTTVVSRLLLPQCVISHSQGTVVSVDAQTSQVIYYSTACTTSG